MSMQSRGNTRIETLGSCLSEGFHVVALFVIGGTIVWCASEAVVDLALARHANLDDILLLFIYLELGAMTGVYFRTRRLPVRFLIYVAMTALTRFLTVDVKVLSSLSVLGITFAILLLAGASYVTQASITRFCDEEDC
jgi:phosphate starvation-inducible membrane PsiE